MKDEKLTIRDSLATDEDGREPYEPPTLQCEDLFETLALACGKVQPQTFSCHRQGANRKS